VTYHLVITRKADPTYARISKKLPLDKPAKQ